jgi:hypothetical protein
VLNRDINSLVRHLKDMARDNHDDPAKYAVIMKVVRAVALGIQEQNPKFNIREFEKRVAGF